MTRNFEYCLKQVMSPEVEGGEVNDPRDPGGHTNLGITQATLNHARNVIHGLPASVSGLTHEHGAMIYEALYWRPIRGDELPLGLAMITFDCAVNQGVGDAARFLQLAVRTVPDGVLGPKTIAAVMVTPKIKAINEVGARRMFDYMQLDHLQDRFGLGWSRRLMLIHAAALAAPEAA